MNSSTFGCNTCKLVFQKRKVKEIHDQLVHNIEIKDSEAKLEVSNLPSFQCSVQKCNHYFHQLAAYDRHFSIAHSRTVIKRQEKQLKTKQNIIQGQKQLLRNKQVIVCF
jgi:uncharacterized C2H2 Zn-finger protein